MCNKKSQLSTKTLAKLRKKLPYGAVTHISKNLGLNKSTVSRVLSGETTNTEVIAEAVRLIESTQQSTQHLEEKINSI